jgi:plasmid stabilization system protein ParE
MRRRVTSSGVSSLGSVRVVFAPEAAADLRATLEFIQQRNPSAAIKLARQVFSTIQKLATGLVDGPQHRLTSGETVRSWLIPPFRVYYQREPDVLRVLRVYHHARRPIAK